MGAYSDMNQNVIKNHNYMKKLFTASFFHLVFGCFAIGVFAQQQPREKVHIYVLMGQSNMAGRGKVTDYYATYGHPRVIALDQAGEWIPAKHPLHFDKPKMAGVGPGLTFGMAMADADPDVIIGLVPCAVGGTPIAKWAPGAYDQKTHTHPYDDAAVRIRKAMETGVIKGIIWHQGEGDSNPTSASVYLEKLETLIGRVRTLVGNPNLPVVAGQLARYREGYQLINRELVKLPDSVPHTAVVSSEGLWHLGDGTHFDSPSASEFGRRFAQGMLALQHTPVTNEHISSVPPAPSPTAVDPSEGWESLFVGNDPNVRWRSVGGDRFPDEGWLAEAGMLTVQPGRNGKDIMTREQFSNFELQLEFMLSDSANTGIKYFVAPLENAKGETVLNGPEYQLIDDFKHESVIDNKSPETSTGSLYLLFAPENKILHKAGEWNHAKIVANGTTVEHWLNGQRILRYERGSDIFRQRVGRTKFNEYQAGYGEAEFGHILLQDHGDQASFRNIRIRRLK